MKNGMCATCCRLNLEEYLKGNDFCYESLCGTDIRSVLEGKESCDQYSPVATPNFGCGWSAIFGKHLCCTKCRHLKKYSSKYIYEHDHDMMIPYGCDAFPEGLPLLAINEHGGRHDERFPGQNNDIVFEEK